MNKNLWNQFKEILIKEKDHRYEVIETKVNMIQYKKMINAHKLPMSISLTKEELAIYFPYTIKQMKQRNHKLFYQYYVRSEENHYEYQLCPRLVLYYLDKDGIVIDYWVGHDGKKHKIIGIDTGDSELQTSKFVLESQQSLGLNSMTLTRDFNKK